MYKGEYSHSIDAKGRITVPVKLRDELGEGFVITKGLDGCLWMLDKDQWDRIEEMLMNMPQLTSREARAFTRFMMAGACDGEVDKQGRLLIPANLREHAGLDKDVVFSGVGSRVEIWDKQRYDEINEDVDIDAITEKLVEQGLRI
ncbi:MAG: division/cell wall cluster transcriptional repressor MraZ [Lachnospiraceae bacterium]|nr:division/cell wall cluster transcriptional repressor MraZ [Lachnospiraceae bacterium]